MLPAHDLGCTLRLSFEGKTLSAPAGRYTLTAPRQLEEDTRAWTGAPVQTMMACEPDLMGRAT